MHEKIAKMISRIVEESPYFPGLFKCRVIRKRTMGFWEVELTFLTDRRDVPSGNILPMIESIGQVYGEKLCFQDKGKKVRVS